MTELEYFRLSAPEFASVVDADVNKRITIAGMLANVACLDTERAALARALYAAHLLRITTAQASAGSVAQGPITSEREGDLQRTYGTVKGSDTWLGQTPYGLQFIDITKACFGLSIMTRGSV